ncbi:uncharacterized protein EV420DRAFT_1565829 [Desarmillaria tabescens]|uniref:Heterokaryon incompatibility domain-containing protein n=1 Tax=Armillaria tabescens TaxID=1929756 RepID=A0AA39JV20_ARMTA|nr:uncharacterized protein EV420DRAFT_1565829 [Desarmillaria tabescens]KAK0449082.1 hypothetical protein EV420DRAFT_1565829 [Desarmillaria tabescens]
MQDDINAVSQIPPIKIPNLMQRILDTEQSKKEKRDSTRKMAVYRESIEINAFTEADHDKATNIKVPLQRKYSGRKPIISNSLADIPCADLGIDGLLSHLNTLLQTEYTLTTPSLSSLLQSCISNNYDFGTAYSRLRLGWFTDLTTIREVQRKLEAEDREMREQGLADNQIRTAMPPRRVWDLHSNRVVLYWLILEEPWAISHDWVDKHPRHGVTTPINGGEWPVLIPEDTNLNYIRIELLNLGAEYVWLDILCLRQKGGKREDLRKEEWISDVPTIGNVFRWSEVIVHYLNGLGRVSGPTGFKRNHFDVCNRSCSQKQVSDYMNDGPWDAEQTEEESSRNVNLFVILASMRNRVSTNPVDKVAGLAYLLRSHTLPAYYESQSLEEAWTVLLLLVYPEPGNAVKRWRPSWDQLMTKLPPVDSLHPLSVYRDERMDEDLCDGFCIEKALVRGLAMAEGSDRYGELIAKDVAGIEHGFHITASHMHSIPEDMYTLLIPSHHTIQLPLSCVAGRRLPGERFEKVSVFEMTDSEEVKRLEELGIAVKRRNILV